MLINEQLANRNVATAYGDISFDQEGKCNDLTQEQQAELGKLTGFDYKADKAPDTETKGEEKITETEPAPKAKAKKATKNDK
jgi:hypothetical protein